MKAYKIKKFGPHDGYKSMEKDLIGLTVIPVDKEPKYREEDETAVLRKGAPPVVTKLAGTYYGEFAIPELQILRTKLDEVYLVGEGDEVENEPKKAAIADIEAEISKLMKKLAEVKGGEPVTTKPVTHKIIATTEEPKPLVATGSMGVMIVEDDSELRKDAVKSGFYKTDEDGIPDPDKPGEEPTFAPVPEEEKQVKFDKADEVARQKAEAKVAEEMKDKMAKVRAGKGKK